MKGSFPRGAATLLITAILLTVALVVTLGMYKTLFFQIKRAQNEVRAKQQFWIAEGGLECIYSLTQMQQQLPTAASYPECQTAGPVTFSYHRPARGQLVVTATHGYSHISKTIRSPSAAPGVLKATSNLYFAGGLAMMPDPGQSLGAGLWGCTLLRYSQNFLVNGNLKNNGLIDSQPPYAGFPSAQSCGSDYQTELSVSGAVMPAGLKKDFVQDSTQTPFEDLFGEARSDWFDVMADNHFRKIAASSLVDGHGKLLFTQSTLPAAGVVADCGEQIRQQILAGQDLLWVYGSCHLSETDLSNISNAIDSTLATADGIILVVHNGLLSTQGALTFKGMIYHFISSAANGTPDFVPDAAQWSALNAVQAIELKAMVDHNPDNVPAVSVANTAYFQRGAFYPTGGYVMDAPGTYAVFSSSMAFQFNRDAIEVPLSKIRKFKWQQGSWYGQ